MENPQETTNVIIKFGIYIAGVSLGLVAKLTTLNKEKTLSWKDVLMHTTIAFASAWLIWNVLDHYHAESWFKNFMSVLVGRFGDSILIATWKAVKMMINNNNEKII